MAKTKRRVKKMNKRNKKLQEVTSKAVRKEITSRVVTAVKQDSIARNEYLATLLFPEVYTGVRIPDFRMFPSIPVSVSSPAYPSTNAAGCLYVGIGGVGKQHFTYPISATSTADWTQTVFNDISGLASINGTYALQRVVSMMAEVEFIGNTVEDAGQIGAVLLADGQNAPVNMAGLEATIGSFVCPLRNGLRIVYAPADYTNMSYQQLSQNATTNLAAPFSVGTTPGFIIMVAGAKASTPNIRISHHVNYEFIPLANTNLYSEAEAGPSSTLKLEGAANYMAKNHAYIPTEAQLKGGWDYWTSKEHQDARDAMSAGTQAKVYGPVSGSFVSKAATAALVAAQIAQVLRAA